MNTIHNQPPSSSCDKTEWNTTPTSPTITPVGISSEGEQQQPNRQLLLLRELQTLLIPHDYDHDHSVMEAAPQADAMTNATAAASPISPTATNSCVDWDAIHRVLQQLPIPPSSKVLRSSWCSANEDPMGRLLICQLLRVDPPLQVVIVALQRYPDALQMNPSAFFTACQDASPQVLSHLVQYESAGCCEDAVCPYAWILSDHVSFENAKIVVEACPEGILMKSPYLGNCSPLDYILMSDDMIQQRTIDITLWNKFKLFLMVAKCLDGVQQQQQQEDTSVRSTAPMSDDSESGCEHPLPVLLDLILSNSSDIFGNEEKARHVLWILHQLRSTDAWLFRQACCKRRNMYPIHHVLMTKCHATGIQGLRAARELVKIVLEAHPSSAKEQVRQRLPLHMALENGWPCHDLLLAVHPDSLGLPDPKNGLFPFQTAALYDWCRRAGPSNANNHDLLDVDDADDDLSFIDGVDGGDVDDIIIVDFRDGDASVDGDMTSDEQGAVDDRYDDALSYEDDGIGFNLDEDHDDDSMDSEDEYDDDDEDAEEQEFADEAAAPTNASSTPSPAPTSPPNPFGELDITYELLRANPAHAFVMDNGLAAGTDAMIGVQS